MKILELLGRQTKLNEAIGGYPKTVEQLTCALVEECGEVSKVLRWAPDDGWRWWTWEGQNQTFDRSLLIEELVDIFKFLLVGIIKFAPTDRESDERELSNFTKDRFIDRISDEHYAWYLVTIPDSMLRDGPDWALAYFCDLCLLLNVGQEEIEAAYIKKTEKNFRRLGLCGK